MYISPPPFSFFSLPIQLIFLSFNDFLIFKVCFLFIGVKIYTRSKLVFSPIIFLLFSFEVVIGEVYIHVCWQVGVAHYCNLAIVLKRYFKWKTDSWCPFSSFPLHIWCLRQTHPQRLKTLMSKKDEATSLAFSLSETSIYISSANINSLGVFVCPYWVSRAQLAHSS